MQFQIIEDTESKFQAELIGADNTVCNIIIKELWKQPNIESAAYNIEHPLVGNPKILVEVKKGDAKKVLQNVCKTIQKTNADLLKQIKSV